MFRAPSIHNGGSRIVSATPLAAPCSIEESTSTTRPKRRNLCDDFSPVELATGSPVRPAQGVPFAKNHIPSCFTKYLTQLGDVARVTPEKLKAAVKRSAHLPSSASFQTRGDLFDRSCARRGI